MSADNYLLVRKVGSSYEVLHLFASEEYTDDRLNSARPHFASVDRDSALRWAHTWANDNVCEYGVSVEEDVWS